MTKTAYASISGKILQEPSSEPVEWFKKILVCSIGGANDNLLLTLAVFTAMSNCVTYGFLYYIVKTIDFSETKAVCDLKARRCIQLIQKMKVREYTRPMSYPDLGPGLFTHKNNTCFSQKSLDHFYSNFM